MPNHSDLIDRHRLGCHALFSFPFQPWSHFHTSNSYCRNIRLGGARFSYSQHQNLYRLELREPCHEGHVDLCWSQVLVQEFYLQKMCWSVFSPLSDLILWAVDRISFFIHRWYVWSPYFTKNMIVNFCGTQIYWYLHTTKSTCFFHSRGAGLTSGCSP